jgi:hypothetical protein
MTQEHAHGAATVTAASLALSMISKQQRSEENYDSTEAKHYRR